MTKFLEETDIIDYSNNDIQALCIRLSYNCKTDIEIAKNCFIFVRDEIKHSGDSKDDRITIKASDVLKHKTGWCYAKSHLLAALLRANKIPCALIYQRLTLSDDGTGAEFCIHGLNSVYLNSFGWYKVDARGNKEGVNAKFDPPAETLAFPIRFQGEKDFLKRYHKPLDIVLERLEKYSSYSEMSANLPDMDL
jgi:transglutaminase-like putative cysteine protease